MSSYALSSALIMAGLVAAHGAATAQPLPAGPALTQAIRAADARLFGLFFEGCDPEKLSAMLTDDLEFYHDKDGVVATQASAFVAGYAKSCAARKAPTAWRSRRALVIKSLRVDPVPGFGAIEAGTHIFYERQGDRPEKPVGKARFTMLWKLDGNTWKLARVMSFGHEALK